MTPDELYEIKVRANYADDAAFDGGQKYIDAAMKSSMDVRALINEVERLRKMAGMLEDTTRELVMTRSGRRISPEVHREVAKSYVRARDAANLPVSQELRDLAAEAE